MFSCSPTRVFTPSRILRLAFLRGDEINDPDVRFLPLEAVDVSLGPDRSLLVVMPDSVSHIEIDSILARGNTLAVHPRTELWGRRWFRPIWTR